MRAAAARTAHGSRTLAPRYPRRVSGPAHHPDRPVARPKPGTVAAPARRVVAIDRLLRGRAWIWVIGVALMGIVAMQVSLLKLNTGISRAVQTSATLERVNAQLEKEIAVAGSNARISRIALERGMIAPDAGQVQFLRARPTQDARRAVDRMRPPSAAARELMTSGGATAAATATTTATTTTAAPVEPVATPSPTATPAAGLAAAPTPGQG